MRRLINRNNLRVAIVSLTFIVTITLSGCANRQHIQPSATLEITDEAVKTSTLAATELSTAISTSTPLSVQTQEPISNERTAYNFVADLDYNKHNLLVRQTIQYQNQTGQALPEITLAVPANAKPNVFSLTSLAISGNTGMVDYSLDGVTLTIQFDNALPKTASISIDIEYTLTPRLQGGILGYTAKQINFSDWYPFVPPYDSANGWIIHQPAEVGEYLVYDCADFDLTLNLVNAAGLVIAGSTEVAPLDLDSFKMIQKNSRGVTFSVSDQYTVLTNTSNGVTVKGYIFPGDEVAGQASVDYTANALQLYSELFGIPYPHPTLSVVESDFPDGMEYDGLYYLSDLFFKLYDGTPQNYLALLSVHETAHQWWFGIVGNDQALEPWLDESLATYSEYLYIERYFPELTKWWWQYRVDYYKPAGRVNLTIYDQSDLRVYINSAYLQGTLFLQEMRKLVGDELFFSGLKVYQQKFQFKTAKGTDFINTFDIYMSKSIALLMQKYFEK